MVSIRTIRLLAIFSTFTLFLVAFRAYPTRDRPWFQKNDFAHYYISAKLYHDGVNPYRFKLGPLYKQYGFNPGRYIDLPTNPPALIQLTEPLVFFRPCTAFLIWNLLQLFAFLGAMLLSMRIFPLHASPLEHFFLLLAAFLNCPFFAHLRYGQTQALMTFLIVIGWLLLEKRKDREAAFLWGVAASLKIFTWPLLFVLLKHRGRRSLLWFTAGSVFLQIPFLIRQGPAPFIDYITVTLPYIQKTTTGFLGNISLTGSLLFTTQILAGTKDFYVIFLPILSIVSFFALLLGVWLILSRGKCELNTATASVLALSIIFSPTAWNHYLILLFPAFILLLSKAFKAKDTRLFYLLILIDYMLIGSTVGWIKTDSAVNGMISTWWGIAAVAGQIALLQFTFNTVPARHPRS